MFICVTTLFFLHDRNVSYLSKSSIINNVDSFPNIICYLKLFTFFLQNFSVCLKCSRLCQLYHRLTHQKHRMFNMCSEVVEGRKRTSPAYDTTKILNELLANDAWLEQVFRVKLKLDKISLQMKCNSSILCNFTYNQYNETVTQNKTNFDF